ncbi:SAC3/GANP/Nin1/mts3/eIF-3 p25 family-domain-containing protein [Amylocarpus encephaloides]|uniref:SAC3/GANP/Nin1/mts3/eIF-3 p25 family-domain-containing protein n=1 Tax=Amylocarpus encephaloides TaxID=45428 RepID=A0A9P7YBS0_9HELO|nr:SAC3/GANP/Nin1/mts3/eIF-3 p25 family-domain-containing protein [Amylocarpus encephaloides]
MSERDLQDVLRQLKSSTSYPDATKLLSTAKLTLLKLKALTPQPNTPAQILLLAREVFETGALTSIRAKDTESFTRYVHQLTPFYELPAERLPGTKSERSKVTGLYLLLLLTQGNYAGFHTELEGLEIRLGNNGELGDDKYLLYPIQLERWLMEGSYDLVWQSTTEEKVPCEEYGIFSEILTITIRNEIASCSETAYPSLPISSTKNLLFLESEGAVIQFAQSRGWLIRDGRIYFPNQNLKSGAEAGNEKELSQLAIENTLGYARELETIV